MQCLGNSRESCRTSYCALQHFDVKSANILLDKNCCAKLADVGLAQTLTEHRGSQQLSTFLDSGDLGTFAWAAPEVGCCTWYWLGNLPELLCGAWACS